VLPQFNAYNGALFTIRTRALNGMLYWLFQIVGSWTTGYILDAARFPRRKRIFASWFLVFCMVWGVWAGNFVYQKFVLSSFCTYSFLFP
jgi:hypothetical protein